MARTDIRLSTSKYREDHSVMMKTLFAKKFRNISFQRIGLEDVLHMKTGHSTTTANSVYGVEETDMRHLDSTVLEIFKQACTIWHGFFGLVDMDVGSKLMKVKDCESECVRVIQRSNADNVSGDAGDRSVTAPRNKLRQLMKGVADVQRRSMKLETVMPTVHTCIEQPLFPTIGERRTLHSGDIREVEEGGTNRRTVEENKK